MIRMAQRRSLCLKPGEVILNTDHEYGSCDYTRELNYSGAGTQYIDQPIPLPVQTEEEIVEQVWKGVTARTK